MKRRFSVGYINFEHVCKYYQTGDTVVKAVDDVNFTVEKGEFCVVLGPSGAGKTTLLEPARRHGYGDQRQDRAWRRKDHRPPRPELTEFRRREVGFVFQFYNLMPNLTALENVEIAVEICENHLDPKSVLESVGLADRLNNFPAELSGGEQQRVSIARAVAKNPKLILCDEPTGALDSKTGVQVLSLLTDVCRTHNATVVIITHNAMIAPLGNRVIHVKNGGIESIETCEHPARVEDIAW